MSKALKLSQVAIYSEERVNVDKVTLKNFVTVDSLLPNKGGMAIADNTPPQGGGLTRYRKENILVGNIRPYLKKIWFADRDGGASADVLVFVVKPEYCPQYVYYALFRDDFFAHMMRGKKGTKMPRGDKDQILNFLIPDYQLPLQQRIAAVLTVLDAKIELNQRINAELEAMAKTLYGYWFVQFDFPNKSGKPYKSSGGKMVWNAELKREIPVGWEVKSLSDITNVSNEQLNPMDAPDKEFKQYSIPVLDESGTYKIEIGKEIKSNKFVVRNTDVLVSKLNPRFSRVVYSTDENDVICSTEFVVWRTTNISIKNYLYMIARDASFKSYCTQSATGTSNSHKRVNPTVMMKYRIVYDNKIAEKFGAQLGATIKTYAKNQIENKILAELRDWLLPMLMNGQVRVS